jgi:hypothetical protein
MIARTFSSMTILFSPLGLNYGVLYSSILLVRPARLVIVTSPQAIGNLHSAIDAARFFHSKFEVETHMLDDPLAGFREARTLARLLCASADGENVVNLTGGTTVMQDCMRSLIENLRSRNRGVREVAVIDRRPPEDQKRSPLVVGELIEVSASKPEPALTGAAN